MKREELERIKNERDCGHGEALGHFRNALYADMTMHIITFPAITYDVKNDRYMLKFSFNNTVHSFKVSNAVVQFVAETLKDAGDKRTFYGFKLVDGIIIDAVAERW